MVHSNHVKIFEILTNQELPSQKTLFPCLWSWFHWTFATCRLGRPSPWQGCWWAEFSELPWHSASSQLPQVDHPAAAGLAVPDPPSCFAHKKGDLRSATQWDLAVLGTVHEETWCCTSDSAEAHRDQNTIIPVTLVSWEIFQSTSVTLPADRAWDHVKKKKKKTHCKREERTFVRMLQLCDAWSIYCWVPGKFSSTMKSKKMPFTFVAWFQQAILY